MKWNEVKCRPLATDVYNAINENHVSIRPGKDATAAKLCGKTFWKSLSAAERRWAGRFVSNAVRLGMFALEQTRRDSANHWRYRRKQPEQRDTPMLH